MAGDRLRGTGQQDDRWPWALAVGFALGAGTIIAILWLQNNVVARWPQ